MAEHRTLIGAHLATVVPTAVKVDILPSGPLRRARRPPLRLEAIACEPASSSRFVPCSCGNKMRRSFIKLLLWFTVAITWLWQQPVRLFALRSSV